MEPKRQDWTKAHGQASSEGVDTCLKSIAIALGFQIRDLGLELTHLVVPIGKQVPYPIVIGFHIIQIVAILI